MRHAPDALLVCNEHKAVPVGEAIRCLEVVGIAFDVIRLPITILVPQQRQVSGLLLRNNDIVIGKDEQSARMFQARDKWRGCEALHHAWRLSCIWCEQRSACRDWIAFRRRGERAGSSGTHPIWSRRRSKVACRAGLELPVSAMPRPSGRVSIGCSASRVPSPRELHLRNAMART